jgi:hypothetical protein
VDDVLEEKADIIESQADLVLEEEVEVPQPRRREVVEVEDEEDEETAELIEDEIREEEGELPAEVKEPTAKKKLTEQQTADGLRDLFASFNTKTAFEYWDLIKLNFEDNLKKLTPVAVNFQSRRFTAVSIYVEFRRDDYSDVRVAAAKAARVISPKVGAATVLMILIF